MSPQELDLLAEDIRRNGLLEAVTMLDGLLLDGRCRWDACEKIGIEPRTVEFSGTDPIAFVLAKNERRRHLPLVQRALIADALAILANGTNRYHTKTIHSLTNCNQTIKVGVENSTPTFSREDAAAAMNISVGSLQDARTLRRYGEPHIVEMVRAGKIPFQPAARVVARTERAMQQTWQTESQVREAVEPYMAARRVKAKQKKPTKGVIINPPYRSLKPIRVEDLGLPPADAPARAHIEHIEKYGKVQLRPKLVQDMINHRDMIGGLVAPILSLANTHQPDAETFFSAVDELLAWQLRKGESNGWATDFAANARKTMVLLRSALPKALALLLALEAKLHEDGLAPPDTETVAEAEASIQPAECGTAG